MSQLPVTIARQSWAGGEAALRRRGPVLELIIDGVFAMDSAEVSTEIALADLALARHRSPRRVLIGGLGLGYTARAVLADQRVDHVEVVEIVEPLVTWARSGIVPELAGLASERCRLIPSDIAKVLGASAAQTWDVVLLDVDNGPDFLVRPDNASLYTQGGLRSVARVLRPSGLLAIWSSHRAPELLAALRVLGPTEEVVLPVSRDGHTFDYAAYLLTAPQPSSKTSR